MYDEHKAINDAQTLFSDMQRWMAHHGLDVPDNMVALEVGAGSGDFAAFVATRCQRVYATDISRFAEGDYNRYLRDRRERYAIDTRPENVEFATVSAEDLIYKDELFDFVFSINAFEHIPRPERALAEVMRVLKPNGLVFIQFDPAWTSPYGHHLAHLITEPWRHLLLSDQEFESQLLARGGGQGDLDCFRTHMNRWPASRLHALLKEVCEQRLSTFVIDYWDQDPATAYMADHPNYALARSAGWSDFDLTVRGFRLMGRKKGPA